MKETTRILLLTSIVITGAVTASAQVTLSGTNYSQTFDNINSGLPPGWSVRTNASGTSLGTAAIFNTTNTSWGTSSGQFANYASILSNAGTNFLGGESTAVQSNCLNRCVGVRLTGSFGDPGAAFVLQLTNTLGLAGFQLGVDFNMLSVQARSNNWVVDYGVGTSPSSFTPVWTNSDPGVFGATTRTLSLGSVLDNQAQNVWIRIVTLEPSAGSNSRDTLGIDNFWLSYGPVGAVSPIPLGIHPVETNVVLSWSNSAFALQTAPAAAGPYTTVSGAANPYTNPMAGPQKFFRLKAN